MEEDHFKPAGHVAFGHASQPHLQAVVADQVSDQIGGKEVISNRVTVAQGKV